MFLSVDPSFKYYDSIQTAVLVLRVPRALRLLRVARYDERERGREREREREEEEERERLLRVAMYALILLLLCLQF
jgi:hypothetical protein